MSCLPREGQGTASFLFRSKPAPDIRTLRSDVPSGLADLLRSLLAKDPEERLQSARQVQLSLESSPAFRSYSERKLAMKGYNLSARRTERPTVGGFARQAKSMSAEEKRENKTARRSPKALSSIRAFPSRGNPG